MSAGYVKLWRKMLEGGILEDAAMLQLWIWLLLNATHQPRKLLYRGETYQLQPGQVFASERFLAEKLRVTKSTLRRRFSAMKSDHRITTEAVHRGTVITICNWETYQIGNGQDGPQEIETVDHKRTADGPQTDRRRTKNKKERREEGENEQNETLPYGSGFAAAWETWLQYRREIRKPLGPSAVKSQLRTLAGFADESRAVEMIEHTIFMGWQGLREKEAPRTGRGSDPAPQYPRG